MAVYDLEEQESIDNLKAWWGQYGRLVIAAVLAFVVGVAGVQIWRHQKEQKAVAAATAFVALEEAAKAGDAKKSVELARKISADFDGTTYSARGAVLAAGASFASGDAATAADLLRGAVGSAKEEPVKALANLRLSAVLLDLGKHDEALAAVSSPPSEAFAALFADARGDVYVAQGKIAEAKSAYQAALDKLPKTNGWRNVVEIKRDALGGQ
jgi:predicted negative regulator of RcsB-dependent stress response